MSIMAVRNGFEHGPQNKYYYEEHLQTFVSHHHTPIQLDHRPVPVPVPYQPVKYTWDGFYGYQQNTLPLNYMATFPQPKQESIFDLDCPDLISQASPTASSLGSGASFAPSPSQDAKDMTMFGTGLSIDSPSNLSPSTDFGFADIRCDTAMSPVWNMSSTLPSSNSSMQLTPEGWSTPLEYSTRPQPSSNYLPSAGVHQPEPRLEDLYAPSSFTDLYQVAPGFPSTRSSQQIMAPSFVGYGEDGFVVPGHFFNTTLDRYAFTAPTSSHLPQDFGTNVLHYHEPTTSFPGDDLSGFTDEPVQSMAVPLSENTRNLKDDYLREARRRGLSYKEIKRRGGFTEAESTLRGRIRILSKPKEMRVRKPQWRRADMVLLHRAVEVFANASQGSSPCKSGSRHIRDAGKLPWKKVAEHMQANGASYPFAGATCAKKWEQVRDMQV